MMRSALICSFVLFLPAIRAAMVTDLIKSGSPHSFDFPGEWSALVKRQPSDETKKPQFIHAGQDYWTVEGSDTQIDKGNVFLHKNGTLTFKSFKESDVGTYTMPNEPPHLVDNGRGALAPMAAVFRLKQ